MMKNNTILRPCTFHRDVSTTMLLAMIVLSVLFLFGCDGNPAIAPASDSEFAAHFHSGFSKRNPRLFVSTGRLGKLFAALRTLDEDSESWKYCDRPETSSDGTSLRFWNGGRTKALIISKGVSPKIVSTPDWYYLDDHNRPVLCEESYREKFTLPDGRKLKRGGLEVDSACRYFCVNSAYYGTMDSKDKPVLSSIRRVSEPSKVLATTDMRHIDRVFSANGTVYLFGRAGERDWHPGYLRCEVYQEKNNKFEFKREFEIHSRKLTTAFLAVKGFDPQTNQFLIVVNRAPFESHVYLYDMDTGKRTKVAPAHDYVFFLDPEIFDATLEFISNKGTVKHVTLKPTFLERTDK